MHYLSDLIGKFRDVESEVHVEQQEIEVLRKKIKKIQQESLLQKNSFGPELEAAHEKLAARRKYLESLAAPQIAECEDVAVIHRVYNDALHEAQHQQGQVQQLLNTELSSYGYAAKKMLAIEFSLDALRNKMYKGEPFLVELKELLKDGEGSKDIAVPLLLESAKSGLPTQLSLLRSCAAMCQTLADVSIAEVVVQNDPLQGSIANNMSSPSSSWLSSLTFDVAKPKIPSPQTSRRRVEEQEKALVLSSGILEKCKAEHHVAALTLLDDAETQLQHRWIPAPLKVKLERSFLNYRREAESTVNALHFLNYCDSALVSLKYNFVESMLNSE